MENIFRFFLTFSSKIFFSHFEPDIHLEFLFRRHDRVMRKYVTVLENIFFTIPVKNTSKCSLKIFYFLFFFGAGKMKKYFLKIKNRRWRWTRVQNYNGLIILLTTTSDYSTHPATYLFIKLHKDPIRLDRNILILHYSISYDFTSLDAALHLSQF